MSDPDKTRPYRKLGWLLALIAAPALLLAGSALLQDTLDANGATGVHRYLVIVTSTLVYGISAWLIDRALRLFIWQDGYRRLTGAAAPAVLQGAASTVIYVVALLIVLSEIFKLDTGAVLLSTGIVAGVLSVAMQNTITDFFSGVALGIDRPYQVGDWIEFEDGVVGEVVSIGWRSTRILSWNSSLYVVPNKKAANSTLHNYDQPTKAYGYWFDVLLSADVSPLVARQLLLQAAIRCNAVLTSPAPIVYLSDGSRLPYRYMVYVHFPNFSRRFAAIDALSLEIHQQLSQAGISPAAVTYEIDTRRVRPLSISVPDIVDILRDTAAFAPLSDTAIGRLADGLSVQEVPMGSLLSREGASGGSMFVIVSGVVSLSRNIDGRSRNTERLKTGQSFGELSLLKDEPRYSTATAVTNVRYIEIPRQRLDSILSESPSLLAQLTELAEARRQHSEALQRTLFDEASDGRQAGKMTLMQRLGALLGH
ncbi:mechanosensitive ion channel [Thiohalocapsa marina]|uniref:Small-conductance mechanosensitive channel n=1 Tax=Thiohalocapsa marina TaxID=424902 RepID=A0A5M8FSW6_9GAMM|nr:mechanosensitive ion channel family protein [Thiohalocapsa marina]KAA6186212.1 mechanosensitive ion channel [Thiohalocapsa marina]